MKKLSPAQWAALSAACAGQLHREESGVGRRRLYAPYRLDRLPVSAATVDKLHELGLLAVGKRDGIRRPLVLTDAGRALMAEHGYTEEATP